MNLSLRLLPELFTIHRFEPDAPLPPVASSLEPLFLVRSATELSIACAAEVALSSERQEPGWRCLEVLGPLDFALTGILAGLAGTLADAGISLFAVSSFDTDFILVKIEVLDRAITALRDAGYRVE